MLTAWGLVSVVSGIGIVIAAGSTHFQMEADPLNFTNGMHGASDTFQLDGQTTWREDSLESTNFQIMHDANPLTSSSSSSSTPTSSSSSSTTENTGPTTTSGGGGGRGAANTGGSTKGSDQGGVSVTEPVPPTAPAEISESSSSASSEQSSTSAPVEEGGIEGTGKNGRGQTSNGGTADGNESNADGTEQGGVGSGIHRASPEEETDNAFLGTMTTAQGVAAMRLGHVYRFEAMFESIPAYRSAGTSLWSAASGMRGGSVALDALLFPFGFLRRKKRFKNLR